MCLSPWLLLLLSGSATASYGDPGVRALLQDPLNQELVNRLGTRFEIVNPLQLQAQWGRGLSTRSSLPDAPSAHLRRTTLLIDTRDRGKLHLDLELNVDLFPSTLVQFAYNDDGPPNAIFELPENCYYHGAVRNYPNSSAAFYTCKGIRGMILLENEVYLIYPLRGNNSEKNPHLLYHLVADDVFKCGNKQERHVSKPLFVNTDKINEIHEKKYMEIGIVLDQALIEKLRLPSKDLIENVLEVINYVDLVYQALQTSISLTYVEIWKKDRFEPELDVTRELSLFQEYARRRINMESIDAVYLLTGNEFYFEVKGNAISESICTENAVGVSTASDSFQPHITASHLTHFLGHNLGMSHDRPECFCPEDNKYVMSDNVPSLNSVQFSDKSIAEYLILLRSGKGSCLFNEPASRMAACGNGIVEESEECDCGTLEECLQQDHCCDPRTCKFTKHAECSHGPCCRKCKFLSSDQICRPSRGECDLSEFCDGTSGQCPVDLYKRSGAVCSGGLGYCYLGSCPLLKTQCQSIWGEESDGAHTSCFHRLNILGTPSGHCGIDNDGDIQKCSLKNSACGTLQCNGGEEYPSDNRFIIHRLNHEGSVNECRARTSSPSQWKNSLVEDGTKCGFQKLCVNQTCRNIRTVTTGKCPVGHNQDTCSGNGICTHLATCACKEGWTGEECGTADPDVESSLPEVPQSEAELKLDPNLAFTVLAGSIITGLVLAVVITLLIFIRNLKSQKENL